MRKIVIEVPEWCHKCEIADKSYNSPYNIGMPKSITCVYRKKIVKCSYALKPVKACRDAEIKEESCKS